MSLRTPLPRAGIRQALPLGAVLTLSMAMSAVADAVATSGFVVRIGPAQLVWLWATALLVAFATSGAVGLVIDRVPRARLTALFIGALTLAYAALGTLLLARVASAAGLVLLFLVADQQYFTFPVVFWTLANDRYRTAEAKRVFPWIQAGATLGQFAGNVFVGTLAATVPGGRLTPLFMLSDVTLGLAALAVLLVTRPRERVQAPIPSAAPAPHGSVGVVLDYVRNVPVLRAIALTAFCGELALLLIQFRFLSALAGAGGVAAVEKLFTLCAGATVVLAAGLQAMAATRWMERVQLKRAFLGLPGLAGLGALVAMVAPGLVGAGVAQVLAQVVKWGWDTPARVAFQGLLPAERRGRIATFLDNYVSTLGSLAACCVLAGLLLPAGAGATWLPSASLGIALAAAGLGVRFGLRAATVYDRSLLNWRLGGRRRSRALQGLDLDL